MTIIKGSRFNYWPQSYINGVQEPGPVTCGSETWNMVTYGNDLRRLGKGDVGSPFFLEKSGFYPRFGYMVDGPQHYTGPTLPWGATTLGAIPLAAVETDAFYWSHGATAISKTEPTNPVFDMSSALGETLTGGLPKMVGHETWKAKTLRAKQAGSEYLNYEFGWLPFVSDLRDFAYAVEHSGKIVSDLHDHANVKIRRALELNKRNLMSVESKNYFIDTPRNTGVGSVRTHVTSRYDAREWFSGCFTYYLPMDNSMPSRMKRYRAYAHKLLGVDLSPEVVWNVAPWSWAVDWKTDVGDVIHNASAIGHNGLVLQYGYIMVEQISELHKDAGKFGYSLQRTKRCRRVGANPYGFGVSSGGLTAQQTAILAALGLSRKNAKTIF